MTRQVRRPNSSASTDCRPASIAPPVASGSKYGLDQPPWAEVEANPDVAYCGVFEG